MVRRSTHRQRSVKVPKESRTNLLFDESAQHKGDKENGKFYRCWNCGQICHDKVHELGGAKSGDAISHTTGSPTLSGGMIPGDKLSATSILLSVQGTIASARLDSDGNAQTVVYSYSTSGGGCPLCHSLNWRGDY